MLFTAPSLLGEPSFFCPVERTPLFFSGGFFSWHWYPDVLEAGPHPFRLDRLWFLPPLEKISFWEAPVARMSTFWNRFNTPLDVFPF